jgi:hypothetical protein
VILGFHWLARLAIGTFAMMTRQHKKKNNTASPKGMPEEAIAADLSKQVPNGSYEPPPQWYVDKNFVCVECSKEETWTAAQQKWYYEEAKGSLYATAKRCHDCRVKMREAKSLQREQMLASKKTDRK